MMPPRNRQSGMGLLPRMETRPWADGKTITYRYRPVKGPPINLGTDRQAALQKALDLNRSSNDAGTVAELWRLYQASDDWAALAPRTQTSYREMSRELIKVFGEAKARLIRPTDVNRYLRVERKDAPVVANREVALLSNLMNLAVARGDLDLNPCKSVRRNKERPRTQAPETADLSGLVNWLTEQGGQRRVIAQMAEFAAYGGSRRMEFLELTWPQIDMQAGVVRVIRGKQRDGVVIWDKITIGERMAELLTALDAGRDGREYVFRNKFNNPYTDSGFKAMWSKLVKEAMAKGKIERRFTFHDLRAYYATTHKTDHGALPDMHKNPATTARIYDRNKEVKRGAL